VTVDIAYVGRSINAAFRLALRDQRAWSGFDLTAEGFFRSFAAILVVIPFNIAIEFFASAVAARRALAAGKPVTDTYEISNAVFSTAVLCIEWMIFPIAMIFVLRFVGLAHRYSALVIAHNWGTVVVVMLYFPGFALGAIGLLPPDLASDFTFVALGLTIYYRFYTAQTALGAGWSIAAAVTCLSIVLQIYFGFGVELASGLWLPAGS
jgi:hypothetical protein